MVIFSFDMAKTNAQRQKEYRERKKQRDPGFLSTENKRVMDYYVPRAQLSKKKLMSARRKRRDYARRIRRSQQESSDLIISPSLITTATAVTADENEGGPCDSTSK